VSAFLARERTSSKFGYFVQAKEIPSMPILHRSDEMRLKFARGGPMPQERRKRETASRQGMQGDRPPSRVSREPSVLMWEDQGLINSRRGGGPRTGPSWVDTRRGGSDPVPTGDRSAGRGAAGGWGNRSDNEGVTGGRGNRQRGAPESRGQQGSMGSEGGARGAGRSTLGGRWMLQLWTTGPHWT